MNKPYYIHDGVTAVAAPGLLAPGDKGHFSRPPPQVFLGGGHMASVSEPEKFFLTTDARR